MNWYFCLHCAKLSPILAKNSSILCSPADVHTLSLLATYVLCGTYSKHTVYNTQQSRVVHMRYTVQWQHWLS